MYFNKADLISIDSMKKNNRPPLAFLCLLTLCTATTLYAATQPATSPTTNNTTASSGTQATTQNNTTTSQTNTSNNTRSIPMPQMTRIQALEDNLRQNQLSHQINILQASGSPFLTLYRRSLTSDSEGCAILLHSDNEHPDWPTAIAPLRNNLPKYSWCTISIEIPDIVKLAEPVQATPANTPPPATLTLPNQALVFARIQAAITDVQKKNYQNVVLIGYGTGAAYAMHFLAQNKTSGEALVLIDIQAPLSIDEYNLAQDLSLIEHPIFDYYYDRDANAHRFAVWRKQAANQRKGDTGALVQLDAIEESKGVIDGKMLLVQRVRGFLKQYTTQVDQRKKLPVYKKGLFYESP